MKQVVIENPVINSPFEEPQRHCRFTDEGITNEIVEKRRVSCCFIPIAPPKKEGKDQLNFQTEWTQDRVEENKFINRVRARVKQWRDPGEGRYASVTRTTAHLLQYWTRPERERRPLPRTTGRPAHRSRTARPVCRQSGEASLPSQKSIPAIAVDCETDAGQGPV